MDLAVEYYKAVGSPSRHVPELTRRTMGGVAFDPDLAWLRRIDAGDAAREVDAVSWAPILIPGSASGHPAFHIPVRPVPSSKSGDSELGWAHMAAPIARKPRSLEAWVAAARAQNAGLLLFPRNPAERALDREGRVR